jgi:ADP-heptose:LPS heptosyltransferase
VLTVPLLHTLREKYPDAKISFIGRTYTKPIVELNKNINQFINWDDVSNKTKKEQINFLKDHEIDAIVFAYPDKQIVKAAFWANIKFRIATFGRMHTLLYCNKKVIFSRKKSDLHESQLNYYLLTPLGVNKIPSAEEIKNYYDFNAPNAKLPAEIEEKLSTSKKNIILHPKSQGSAVEWSESNFLQLAELLVKNGFTVWITGTEKEASLVPALANIKAENIHAVFGRFSLTQFIQFINQTDGLVAASTGPLHIAAAFNKLAVGLFSPKRPIHPGRWKPIGNNATVLVSTKLCEGCQKGGTCTCIESITPEQVLEAVLCFL